MELCFLSADELQHPTPVKALHVDDRQGADDEV